MKTKSMNLLFSVRAARHAALRLLSAAVLLVVCTANALADDVVHAVVSGVPYLLYPGLDEAHLDHDAISEGQLGSSVYFERWVPYVIDGKVVKFDAGKEIPVIDHKCASNVKSVTVGDGIESLDSHTFSGWARLESVSLKSSDLKTVGNCAFCFCQCLQSVSYDAKATDDLLAIYDRCFEGCPSLTSVYLPDNRPYVFEGTEHFKDCTSLKSISLPKGLQKNSKGLMLPDGIFSGCNSLADLSLADHVSMEEMASDAFSPSRLTTFAMPFSVKYDATAINGSTVSVGDETLNVRVNLKDNTALLLGASDPTGGVFYVPGEFTIEGGYEEMGFPTTYHITGLGDYCLSTNLASSIVMPKSLPIKVALRAEQTTAYATQAPLAKHCFNSSVKSGWTDKYKKETVLSTVYFYTEDGSHFRYNQFYEGTYVYYYLKYADDGNGNYGWETKTQQTENVIVPHSIYLSNLPLDYQTETDDWKANYNKLYLADVVEGCFDNNPYVKSIKFVDHSIMDYLHINNAFNNCPELTEVTIPARATLVSGFHNCDNLKKVSMDYRYEALLVGVDAFKACRNLEELSIKRPLRLRDRAFIDCPNIKEFHAEAGITSIGVDAFKNCTSLRSIKIENAVGYTGYTLDKINIGVFGNCPNLTSAEFVLPINTVCNGAFAECPNLNTLMFDQHVGTIEAKFMDTHAGILTLYFGADVSNIGERAFAECRNLSSVTFTGAVGTVGKQAFYKERVLASASFGSTVDLIGSNAFSNCKALTDLTFGGAVGKIGQRAFERCEGLTGLTLPMNADKEAELDSYAFNACTSLRYVILKDCKKIGDDAFWQCGNLVSAQLGDKLTSLGDDAFSAAPVASLVLPATLTTIGGYLGGAMKAVVLLSDKLDATSIDYLNKSLAEGAKVYCPCLKFGDYEKMYAGGLTKATLVPMNGYKYCNVKNEDSRLVTFCYNHTYEFATCYNVKNFYTAEGMTENSCVVSRIDLKEYSTMGSFPYIAEVGDDPSRLMVFAAWKKFIEHDIGRWVWLQGIGDTAEGYYEVGDYILQSDNMFHRVGQADTFAKKPNTGYIPKEMMDKFGAQSAQLRMVVEDGGTTGIDILPADGGTDARNLPMYNLAGQRISALVKGQLYIQGGKKYMKE